MVFKLPKGSSCLDGLRVLFVDGSSDERDRFRALVEPLGAVVVTAATVDEAVDVLWRDGADMLVSEPSAPAGERFELISRVRTLSPVRGGCVPAIAISTEANAAITAGYSATLASTGEVEALVAVVAGLLPQVEDLRAVRMRSRMRMTDHQAFREQLCKRRIQLQKRHAKLLASSEDEQERHFARKTLALLTAQEHGEAHFGAPLDDVELGHARELEDGAESWTAVAVCGHETLTIELVISARGDVAVRKVAAAAATVH